MTAARLLFLALIAALSLSAVRDVWSLDPDAAAYVSLGRSLAAGEGYALFGEPHAKYPPGLPALLALLMSVAGPTAYGVFHAALVLAVFAAAVLAERLARALGLGPLGTFAVGAATALSVTLFELSVRYLRTEALFTALGLAALLALLRALGRRAGWGATALAAALVVAALSTRLAGLGLLLLPAWALLRPPAPGARGRALAILLLAGAGLAAWAAHGASVREARPEAPDYRQEFLTAEPRDLTKVVRLDNPPLDASALTRRVLGNGVVLARATAVLLSNVDQAGHQLPVGAALLALVLLGGAALWRRTNDPALTWARRAALLYSMASVALLLVWPFDQAERFYVPLLPLFLVAAGAGLQRAAALLSAASRGALGRNLVFAGGLLLLAVLAAQRSNAPKLFGRWSYAYAGLVFATAAALTAAVLLLRRPRALRLPGWAPLLAVALFALPYLHARFVTWPRVTAAFEARRAAEPAAPPLDRIDVHPVLEQVARELLDRAPPGAVVMSDVPKMLAVLTGLPCVPLRYTVEPPELFPGEASVLFCTGSDPPEAGAVVDALSPAWTPLVVLPPIQAEGLELRPTVWRLP